MSPAFLSSVLSKEYYTYYQTISLNFARVKKNMMRQFVCGSQLFQGSYLNLTGKGAFQKVLVFKAIIWNVYVKNKRGNKIVNMSNKWL